MKILIPTLCVLSACFSPSLPADGLTCSVEGTCPPGQFCHPDNTCRSVPPGDGGAIIDAPVLDARVGAMPDAMIDAPLPPDARPPAIRALNLAAGLRHTCAVLDNESVRCWGYNVDGQLGLGSMTAIGDTEHPNSIDPIELGAVPTGVAAGLSHSCTLSAADGGVRCWGRSSAGRLGYLDTQSYGDNNGEVPSARGAVVVGGLVESLYAGGAMTCAILQGGSVRCWGYNGHGQLGQASSDPIGDDETPGSVPVISLGAAAEQLAVGEEHICARLIGGVLRCWGWGQGGRLGLSSTSTIGDGEVPTAVDPVDLGDGVTVIDVAAGGAHTCAVTTSKEVFCWGIPDGGRLGYGDGEMVGDNETPAMKGPVSVGGNVEQVVAGASHTCARLTDGTVRCWGANADGQLGRGNTDPIGDTDVPSDHLAIDLGGTAIDLVAGDFHTCAILSDGAVRCWGESAGGQLGYSSTQTIGDTEAPSSAGPVMLD
jgi:alpha-tubulin suppressor-like RCC1 family protein